MSETTEATKSVHTEQSREDKKCSQANCKRPYKAKGLCIAHYRAWRHGKLPKSRYKICTKEGCRKPRAAQGSLCAEHLGGAEKAAG
jgi:hypothetical protein